MPRREGRNAAQPGTVPAMAPQKQAVQVEGRRLTLSNLDKMLYPETGFTKGEVIHYYTAMAEAMLPHIAARPMTFKRYPNGVDGMFFFEKNKPNSTPDWVRTARLPTPGSTMDRDTIDFVIIEDLPALVWAANLAALELHVPQWTVGPRGGVREPDLLVLDLDPGPPATIVECARVACLLRDALAADGLEAYPKTSGSKGMQLYAPVAATSRTHAYAKELAQRLEREHPKLVVHRMEKSSAPGQGPRRLVPEQHDEDHHRRLLPARSADAECLDTGHLGRGRGLPIARRPAIPRTGCRGSHRPSRRPARAAARPRPAAALT